MRRQMLIDENNAILIIGSKGNSSNNGVLSCPVCHSFVSMATKLCKRCKTNLREPDVYKPTAQELIDSIIVVESLDNDDDNDSYCELCGNHVALDLIFEVGGIDLCYVCYNDYNNGAFKDIWPNFGLEDSEIDVE